MTSTTLPINSSLDTRGGPNLSEDDHVSTGTVRYPDSWQRQERQAVGLAYGAIGAASCRRRASLDRRLLSKHRLSAQQERNLERQGRTFGARGRPVRRGDRPC